MFKIIGIVMLAGASAAWGFQQADALQERVRLLEETMAFWGQFRVQLEKLRATPQELVRLLRRQELFAQNPLACCLEQGFEENPSFGQNLLRGLDACPQLAACGAKPILTALGDVIGSQDLEVQLTALDSALDLLERQRDREEARCKQYSGLYRRLGILGGLGLGIVFF